MAAVRERPDAGAAPVPGAPATLDDEPGIASLARPMMRAIAARACMVEVEEGLHLVEVDGVEHAAPPLFPTPGAARLSGIQVCAVPHDPEQTMAVIGADGADGSWLEPAGGTIVVQAPSAGGSVIVTAYATAGDADPLAPEIRVRRLDRGRGETRRAAPTLAAVAPSRSDVRTEIVLHVERLGDRQFPGEGWVGNRGRKLRVEAFSIRPVETLTARDIQFRAFGSNGRETPWVTDANLCGTRGRGLPLTGFAVRLSAALRERYDVIYQGAFFESGVSAPCSNGEPCKAELADDPLEAINIRIVAREPA